MDFIKFLAKNNAYRQFMHNLAYCPDHKFSWNDYKTWNEPWEYIPNAFIWEESKERYDFWYELAKKWQKELEK